MSLPGVGEEAMQRVFLAPGPQHKMPSALRRARPAMVVAQAVSPSLDLSFFICRVRCLDWTAPKSLSGPDILRR